MNSWIIFNGSLRIEKINMLVSKVSLEARKKGINIELVANDEISPLFDSNGKAGLMYTKDLIDPDFIIFWDKDIMLATHLEKMGYRLFNKSEAIQACDNKSLMHIQLANLGIKMPKTIIAPFAFGKHNIDEHYAKEIFNELGSSVVIKESYGSFGEQVYKAESITDFLSVVRRIDKKEFIIQEYIQSSFGRDIRINIIGDEIVGAMERSNQTDFRANITLGGKGSLTKLSNQQKEIALAAHNALNLDFCGVDLLFGENGDPILCEVNSNVNFLSYEEISGLNFSDILLNYIIKEL